MTGNAGDMVSNDGACCGMMRNDVRMPTSASREGKANLEFLFFSTPYINYVGDERIIKVQLTNKGIMRIISLS